ncbi:MAG: hypothetical protein K5864_01790 [Bacteroidales bacterium]|nr:hypothetical protein [Bacteroidales bacterium]
MEQQNINKQDYPPMHTEGTDSSAKKPFVIERFFARLLKNWWVPVCMTMLCYLFGLAGDFYSYANNSDYLIDWVPYTRLSLLIGCLSFLWRGTAFFVALAKKKWNIVLFLFLFHLLCWALFYFVALRYYPYSEL